MVWFVSELSKTGRNPRSTKADTTLTLRMDEHPQLKRPPWARLPRGLCGLHPQTGLGRRLWSPAPRPLLAPALALARGLAPPALALALGLGRC